MIDGDPYWTAVSCPTPPLQYILDYTDDDSDKCIFQVDLFSARGAMPQNLFEVAQREKEIRYSSRTRPNTDAFQETQTHSPRGAAHDRQEAAAAAARRGLGAAAEIRLRPPPSPS